MSDLTVLSYNVWGVSTFSTKRFRRIAQYLHAASTKYDVDVIVLNEVLWGMQYDFFRKAMAEWIPVNDPFFRKRLPVIRGGGSGVMVLLNPRSGIRVGEVSHHVFERAVGVDRAAAKGFTHVPLVLRSGVPCNIFATHLQAEYVYSVMGHQFQVKSWSKRERRTIEAQLRQMTAVGSRLPNSVYVGDMNTDDITLFQRVGLFSAMCHDGMCGTFFGDGDDKAQHLDHVLTHAPQPHRVRMIYNRELQTLSDHFPIVMRLSFPKPK